MDNLINKRRMNISNYLVEFFPSDISKLISTYDYYLEGKSYFLKNNERLNDPIMSKCFDIFPDGRIVNGYNNNVEIWNSKTGNSDIIFEDHLGTVFCVAALSDERVVSGSVDKTLKIWNLKTKKCDLTFNEHSNSVRCVAVLHDGRIVSSSYDRKIKIWNQYTGQCDITIENDVIIYCIVVVAPTNIFPDGCIISGSGRGEIKIWNPNGKYYGTLVGHKQAVYSIVILFDIFGGREFQLASGSHDGTIKIWNLQTQKCNITLSSDYKIDCITVLHDGRIGAVSSKNVVTIWDSITGHCDSTFTFHHLGSIIDTGGLNGIAVLADGRIICTISRGSLCILS
jgi:WD40 repeat protein